MAQYPQDIANEVLMACGWDSFIGEIEEGGRPADLILQKYSQCLRQLSRAAQWDHLRKQSSLTMLADATGNTAGVGTKVIAPFLYEYSYPIDCMQARFVPWNWQGIGGSPSNNTSINTSVPQTGGAIQAYPPGIRLVPAPFLITQDTNYPILATDNWMDTIGTSPVARIVILTNVNQAQMVYTCFMPYPSMWPSDFRAAFVAFLASEVALPLWSTKDRKFGAEIRKENYAIAKQKVIDARVASANESGFPQSTDIIPDYIGIRSSGAGFRGGFGDGGGSGFWGAGVGWGGGGYLGYSSNDSVF